MSRYKVLIAHPGRQHSHQAASALYERGMLGEYWTGVPAGRVTRFFPWLALRYGRVDFPPEQIRWMPVAAFARKAGGILGRRAARLVEHLGHGMFDRAVSATLRRRRFDAVIGYEGATRRGFATAKALGLTAILDAASVHYSAHDTEGQAGRRDSLSAAIIRQKEEEIHLADAILVASTLARDSYVAAGVPVSKLHVLPLGVDLDDFQPEYDGPSRPFTFAFAGNVTRAKGVDLLLTAFARVRQSSPELRLEIFGSGELEKSTLHSSIQWNGRVAPHVLAAELRKVDCLVLPSRFDSYGLVVAEALASGVPVIVSDTVGSRDLIEPDRNGWIVPSGDAEALSRQMQWCVENQQRRSAWRERARESGQKAAWSTYHQRFATTVESILSARN